VGLWREKGPVLEKMKVLPGAVQTVMNRLVSRPTNRTRQTLLSASNIKMDLPCIQGKFDFIHMPRVVPRPL
jgi:hypothetical protein